MSSELFTFCFWAGYEGRSQYISAMSETQGGGLSLEQFPPNTTPARAREPAPLRGNGITETGQLHVDYFCLMFTFNVR